MIYYSSSSLTIEREIPATVISYFCFMIFFLLFFVKPVMRLEISGVLLYNNPWAGKAYARNIIIQHFLPFFKAKTAVLRYFEKFNGRITDIEP